MQLVLFSQLALTSLVALRQHLKELQNDRVPFGTKSCEEMQVLGICRLLWWLFLRVVLLLCMREAALSLGVPQWKVTTNVLYRAARSGITTGVLLGLARISGETAPLIFTNTNNQYWSFSPMSPMANIPMTIYEYAKSPFEDWQQLAWAGALIVTLFVLLISVTARIILLRNKVQHD